MDHPRLRGEKALMESFILYITGSPPLTRGKAGYITSKPILLRITPAYAGKSVLNGQSLKVTADHPRLRGEKSERS